MCLVKEAMKIAGLILISALITAFISGVFGMAGGLIFMGIIATIMGVAEAMVVHGLVQSVSNGYRSFLLRSNVRWDILGFELIGAAPAIGLLGLAAFIPEKHILFLALGLLPLLLWLPRGWLQGNIAKPSHAVFCGFSVMGLNLVAGVAGPALDFFYVKTTLTRKEIVATKAVTMFASHIVKIFFFGLPLVAAHGLNTLPPAWIFIAVIPFIMLGTFLGTRLLHKFSDVGFRTYTKYLVTAIGGIYLWRGLTLMGAL